MDATVRAHRTAGLAGTGLAGTGLAGTAGLALVAAGVLAVVPAASPADLHVANGNVRLTSSGDMLDVLTADLNYFDWSSLLQPQIQQNIATNLFYDVVNMPYNWLQAVDFYSKAGLGYPGVYGTDQEPGPYDPQDPNPVLAGSPSDPAKYPISAPIGPDHSYVPVGIGGTGSWWMESLGNTWGWDEGNFGQVLGLSNMVVPIPQFSTPFADELQALGMAEIVANPQDCPFECPDILGYLGRWFNVPPNDLLTGVTVGNNFGGADGTAADPTGPPIDPMGLPISWAGDKIQLDPFFFITSFLNSLAMDPSTNLSPYDAYSSLSSDPSQLLGPFLQIVEDLVNDFNPSAPGSFVYWGAPSFYTAPALVSGLISSVTGIANPMAAYTLAPGGAFALGPYLGQEIVGGETLDLHTLFPDDDTPLGHPINAFQLLGAYPAGFLNFIGGLLGYLEPNTYLQALGMNAGDLGLGFWQDGVHAAISQLAGLSNDLIPWYAPLTIGMEGLLP